MNPPAAPDLWSMRSAPQCGRLKDQAAMLSSDPGGRTFKWKYPKPEEVPDVPLVKKKAPEEAMLTHKHDN